MDRREFLEKLRTSLSGKLPASVVAGNIAYYDDYLNTEIRKGRSEEEVLASLGDPRLIARTIVETEGRREGQAFGFHGEEDNGWESGGREGGEEFGQMNHVRRGWLSKVPGWVWLILALVIVVSLLSIVFRVLVFLAPILIIIMVVSFLVKLFRDWIN